MALFWDERGGCCACTRDKCTYDCATYRRFKPKPITNSMRIRTMTDAELAEFLWTYGGIGVCPPIKCTLKKCGAENCWLNWLKQESKE